MTGTLASSLANGSVMFWKRPRRLQRRRAAALREPLDAEEGGETRRQHVDGDAGDELVALEGDGGGALQRGGADRDAEAGEEAEPDVAGDRGDRGGAEGGGEHLALEADVEDAGALGIEAGETGEQQRRREPDGRVEGREDEARDPLLSSPS